MELQPRTLGYGHLRDDKSQLIYMNREEYIRSFVESLEFEDMQFLDKFLAEKSKRKETYDVSFQLRLSDDRDYDIEQIIEDVISEEFSKPHYKVGEGLIAGSINVSVEDRW